MPNNHIKSDALPRAVPAAQAIIPRRFDAADVRR